MPKRLLFYKSDNIFGRQLERNDSLVFPPRTCFCHLILWGLDTRTGLTAREDAVLMDVRPAAVLDRAPKGSIPTDLKAAGDISQSRWLVDGLEDSCTVSSIVPRGFECYARVLHPAWRYALENCHVVKMPVAWNEVASRRGRVANRLMQWPQVSGLPKMDEHVSYQLARGGCVILDWPDEGTIPLTVGKALKEVLLCNAEDTDSCWFGLWVGYGPGQELGLGEPKAIGNRHRQWYLFRGCLGNIEYSFSGTDRHQSANLVWAQDRSWCLGVDINLHSTYIGGSESLVSNVLKNSELEAYTAHPGDNVGFDADRANPPEPDCDGLVIIRYS